MIEIDKAAVAIQQEYVPPKEHSGSGHTRYWLHLKLEVPGGELRYKVDIKEDVYKSIEFAAVIIKQGKK